MTRDRPCTPPLLELYAVLPGVQPDMPVGEPVMTTAPLPDVALIAATPCLQVRYIPVRLTPTISSHTDFGRVPTLPSRSPEKMPALEQTMSSLPYRATISLNAASTPASSLTSTVMAIASPPSLVMLSTVCLAPSALRSRTATLQPSSPRRWAAAWPMPEPAPVTAATFPFKPRMFDLPNNRVAQVPGCVFSSDHENNIVSILIVKRNRRCLVPFGCGLEIGSSRCRFHAATCGAGRCDSRCVMSVASCSTCSYPASASGADSRPSATT